MAIKQQHLLLNQLWSVHGLSRVHGVLFMAQGSMKPVDEVHILKLKFDSHMYFYCQFAGHSAVETFHLISCGLLEVKTFFFAVMGFSAVGTYHLFWGSWKYLNKHSGAQTTIN